MSRSGETRERLEYLIATAEEWAADLEIPVPTDAAAERARRFLDLFPVEWADDNIRIFPNEEAGYSFQTRNSKVLRVLRIVDLTNEGIVGTWVGDYAIEHPLTSDAEAAAFLQHALTVDWLNARKPVSVPSA